MNKLVLSEDQECELLADYLRFLQQRGKIKMFTKIPNETYTTSWKQKRKNKLLGVSSGFPDYMIVFKARILALEMKRKKGGVVSTNQEGWLNALQSVGIPTAVCAGFEPAKLIIDQFI